MGKDEKILTTIDVLNLRQKVKSKNLKGNEVSYIFLLFTSTFYFLTEFFFSNKFSYQIFLVLSKQTNNQWIGFKKINY